jgi:hypothetical protein
MKQKNKLIKLLLACISQFTHIEDIMGVNRLSTTKSLVYEIEHELDRLSKKSK